jgi:hypothetical protein
VLFVQLLDDVLVVVLAVDVYQHGLDRRVALDERAWKNQLGQGAGGGGEDVRVGDIPRMALTMVERALRSKSCGACAMDERRLSIMVSPKYGP